MTAELQRVSKLLAARGVCSRREADRLIAAGLVRVDGELVEAGAKAAADAEITVAQAGLAELAGSATIALHKPPGVVSTMPQRGQTDARALVRKQSVHGAIDAGDLQRVLASERLSVAGRLDRASRGLLILTDDGVVARALIGGNRIAKRYLVTVASDVAHGQVVRLRRPMRLDQRQLLPMKVERVAPRQLRFELVEGMKHQIRRCCARFGLEVVDLLRDGIGPIELGSLPEGRWRPLDQGELDALRSARIVGE